MNFLALVDRWRKQTPDLRAVIIKGKGCTWGQCAEMIAKYQPCVVFTLNNDGGAETSEHGALHFDVHRPRHHPNVPGIPTMVHWGVNVADTDPRAVPFPIHMIPRRKLGCTTAYMCATAWILRKFWPNLVVAMPGCDYNGTPAEREKEKFSILYWIGRLEEQHPRRIDFGPRSRLCIDEDYH